MNNKRFDFRLARELVSAYSAELFGEPLFDFYGVTGQTAPSFAGLMREAYSSFGKGPSDASDASLAALSLEAMLLEDAHSIYSADPAATSQADVIFSYPGFFAILCHRLSHILFLDGVITPARLVSEYAHSLTGIDIHPGASIGESFSIDHGTGVVIGETAVIGRDVRIYQGVTVGAKSFPRTESGELVRTKKRHPTICDGCIIYANATILGADTVIGEGSVIGANVWLTHSVAPGSKIYYARK